MIGMPALIEFDTFKENVDLCRQLELDFIEINMNLPMFNHEIDIDMIKDLIGDDIGISLHLSENFDPFELDPIDRKARLESFKRALQIAESLDAIVINMHLSKGIHFTLPDGKLNLYKKYKEDYLSHVRSFCEILKNVNHKICIENTGIHDLDYIQEATEMMLEVDGVYLTYDIGHDITSGYRDKSFYDKHKHAIKHFHIHDATEKNNHLELFTGKLDIKGFIEQARHQEATCVIEVKSSQQLMRSINRIKDII